MSGIVRKPSLDVVIPCYNESANLPSLFEALSSFREITEKNYSTNFIFIDNSSTDETPTLVKQKVQSDSSFQLVRLSRNFGKEASMTAGLMESKADLVVLIDADLQDPLDVVIRMLDCWSEFKPDIVLARRKGKSNSSTFRNFSSKAFNFLFKYLSENAIPEGVGEFRLMNRKVVDAFKQIPESQRFVRGIFAWMGFESKTIEYFRQDRKKGKSSFSVGRLLNLGIDGIVSFSIKPLRMSIACGFTIAISSFIAMLFILFQKLRHSIDLPGYTSIVIIMLFLGGIQLVAIGILGEYLGKTMLEAKRRPIYFISERYPE